MDFDSIIRRFKSCIPSQLKNMRYDMAKWNKYPEYAPLSDINGGEKYADGDGMFVEDINKLFENVKYLMGE